MDRDIRLNMEAKLKPGGDSGLKQLTQTIKELGTDADKTFKEYNKAFEAAERATKKLERALDGVGKASKKSLGQLADDARRANEALEAVRQKLAQAGAPPAQRGPGGLSRLGSATAGRLAGTFGGLASAGFLANAAMQTFPHLSDFDAASGFSAASYKKRLTDSIVRPLPLIGDYLADASMAHDKEFQGLRDIKERERALKQEQGRSSITLGFGLQRQALEREAFQQQALATAGQNTLGGAFRAERAGTRLIEQFQANQFTKPGQVAPFAGVPGKAGYNRAEAMQDYAKAVQVAVGLEQTQLETERQLKIVGLERVSATKQEQAARQKLAAEVKALSAAERNAEVQGLDPEQKAARKLQIEQQLVRVREAQKLVEDAQGQARKLEVEQSQILLHSEQERVSLLKSQYQYMTGIVQHERERETARRQSFGLLHPMRQRTALGIGRKLAQGRQLTQREIEFASGMPELFGERLKGIADQRTGAGSIYSQLRGLLPELGQRQQVAEQTRITIENKIKAEIQVNEGALADQLAQKVVPEIKRMQQQMAEQFNLELRGFHNQQWLQNQAAGINRG